MMYGLVQPKSKLQKLTRYQGCNRSLDPLLAYPAWLRRTNPTGISNDAMGAVPRHPFFLKAIDSLPEYNRRWLLPYITVMASTGPLYLSIIWRHYNSADPQGDDRVRILFPDEYNNHPWSFFTHHLGNSWHGGDVKLIFWVSSILSLSVTPEPFLTLDRWLNTGSSSPSWASPSVSLSSSASTTFASARATETPRAEAFTLVYPFTVG